MNSNPPSDFIDCGHNKMPKIINIQKDKKVGLVRTSTGKTFPVHLQDWLIDGIMHGDYVDLKKSPVTGEWIVVDYHINMEIYGALHNEIQDTLPVAERDYCYNAEGVKYE